MGHDDRVSVSESNLRQAVREGVARMGKRRRVVSGIYRFAGRGPETAARGLIVLATRERDRLHAELQASFGFSVVRDPKGFRCRFTSPGRRPKTPEEKVAWLDGLVLLVGYVRALDVMHGAVATSPRMAEGELSAEVYDRARKTPRDRAIEVGAEAARREREDVAWKLREDRPKRVVHAFIDAYERTPVLYFAFAADEGSDPFVREYASAMAAGWARTYLKGFPGSKIEEVLEGEDWANELVSASLLAWQELGPDSPIKHGTRFRDKLPRQQDGRRQRTPGPPDLINSVSRILDDSGSGQKASPPELELAAFADRETREAALQRGRDAGLTPREMEFYRFFIENPTAKNSEAADHFRVSVGTVKKIKHRIKNTPGAA